MTLTVYYDGQFWVGVIEIQENGRLKAYRYVFGTEPSDSEVLEFVNHRLLAVLEKSRQIGIKGKRNLDKKINPKRLQRQVAKEMKQKGVSTQAQEAIKEDIERRKAESKQLKKRRDDAFKQRQWEIKKQKAKQKHKGR
ncbi:YjdF family protein [Bacillus sp. BRMEA1]|uniref:YjdF family protein n=1 Tax=Neobacillus endophyticus TaxID=2738405 RepID=UPI0015670DED|nr:YjdF family protein [Neobacillus endophyticus]NRD78481.1 YjdF family protein [Neobacillus endophyticus]